MDLGSGIMKGIMKYKTVIWNTSSTRKSEPPADKKLIKRLHNKWCRANGYKPQASSSKLQAAGSPAGFFKKKKS
jgi:hypothetical protein